jgi:DNA primase RepB-like protein
MSCELFEIGILRPDGLMLLRSPWSAKQVDAALAWLRRENARGAHIFVRPHGAHALSLVDDLNAKAIARMTDAGFQPAAVVETSPGNFQVWLNHGRTLSDRFLSTLAARQLALRFGGDRGCAEWRHFGRLVGFTNQKPNRRLRNGLPPFVRLRQCEGRTYTAAREFLEEVKSLAQKASAQRCTRTISRKTSTEQPIRSPAEFHRDARYGGDLHRADMAWALHAASRGLSERQIRDQLFRARDLSKKGLLKRQVSYAERTACKALRIVEPNP